MTNTGRRPRAASSGAPSSCASSSRCRGSTSTSPARPTSARPRRGPPRGATGASTATLVELALAGARPRSASERRRPSLGEPHAPDGRPRRGRRAPGASSPTGSPPAGRSTRPTSTRPASSSGRPAGCARSTGGRPSSSSSGRRPLGALTLRFDEPVAAADLRGVLRRPHPPARDRPRPAAPAGRDHPPGDPARAARRRWPGSTRSCPPGALAGGDPRRDRHPGLPLRRRDPVRRRRDRDGRPQAARLGRAADRPLAGRGRAWSSARSRPAIVLAAPARGPPDHAPDVRPVRAVPHRSGRTGRSWSRDADPVVRVAGSAQRWE